MVIPSFNHPDLLARCVDSVLNRSTYPNLEVVIVDNGSDDPALGTLYAELAVDPECGSCRIPAISTSRD